MTPEYPPRRPILPRRPLIRRIIGWMRASLFSSPLNTLLTILVAWLLLMAVPALIEWLFIRANFDRHHRPGMPRIRRRLLGFHRRETSPDSLRHLSLRRTMAALAGQRHPGRGHCLQLRALVLETLAAADLDSVAQRRGALDVGRRASA